MGAVRKKKRSSESENRKLTFLYRKLMSTRWLTRLTRTDPAPSTTRSSRPSWWAKPEVDVLIPEEDASKDDDEAIVLDDECFLREPFHFGVFWRMSRLDAFVVIVVIVAVIFIIVVVVVSERLPRTSQGHPEDNFL